MNKKIYPDGYAALLVGRVGQLYRPYNRTEKLLFFAIWCEKCRCNDICKIKKRAVFVDGFIDAKLEYPSEFQYRADGQPCCVVFEVGYNLY